MAGVPIRIAVVDDHQVFTDAMAERLRREPDLSVVGTAQDADGALALLETTEVDVVTVDLALGADDGLDLARDLLARWPDVRVVLVTGVDADERCLEALRSGVRGWVPKAGPSSVLVEAIRGVACGETHVPAALLTRVLSSLTSWGEGGAYDETVISRLSSRELDVLRCLVDGRSRKEIGLILDVSPNTIRTHVQSILHKLGVHSALTAVAVARRAGVRGQTGSP
jgi:DNA-binding NarL/FixJ family response regulator